MILVIQTVKIIIKLYSIILTVRKQLLHLHLFIYLFFYYNDCGILSMDVNDLSNKILWYKVRTNYLINICQVVNILIHRPRCKFKRHKEAFMIKC